MTYCTTAKRFKLDDGSFVEKSVTPADLATYPRSSPWGAPDQITEYAPGIAFYETPSHGGFYLSPDRRRQVPAAWSAYAARWARKPGWFEEDCAWAAVALTWPELFTARMVEAARGVAAGYFDKH